MAEEKKNNKKKSFQVLLDDIKSHVYNSKNIKFIHDPDACCNFDSDLIITKYEYPNLNSTDIVLLKTALAHNPFVFMVCLCCNHMDDEAAEEFAKLSNILELHIPTNSIGFNGAIAIAKMTTLRALDISNNKIRSQGSLKSFLENDTLIDLDIKNCGFNYNEEQSILKKVNENRKKWVERQADMFYSLCLLSNEHENINSLSIWKNIPKEIKKKIFQFVEYNSNFFYKTESSFKNLSYFLLENSMLVKQASDQKKGIKIKENLAVDGKGDSFSFFSKNETSAKNKFTYSENERFLLPKLSSYTFFGAGRDKLTVLESPSGIDSTMQPKPYYGTKVISE